MLLSFTLSGAILVWMVSIPFRMSGSSLANSDAAGEADLDSLDLVGRIQKRRTEAEQYREMAIELDREFMARLAEKRAQEADRRQSLPGTRAAQAHFAKLRERRAQQIERLGDPEEGSSEWGYLQELKATDFSDAPVE